METVLLAIQVPSELSDPQSNAGVSTSGEQQIKDALSRCGISNVEFHTPQSWQDSYEQKPRS